LKTDATSAKFDMKRAKRGVERVLEICERPGRVLILMQDNPDPDAIASAAAVRELVASHLHKRALIGYGGICGRAENRAMMTTLHIEAHRVTPSDVLCAKTVCLVDCQPYTGNNALHTARAAEIVIDHHLLPRPAVWTAEFADVRPEYGATSTILYEYLRAACVDISENLATALFYGVQSDTQDLGRQAASPDICAFQDLFLLANKKKLARIRRAAVPPRYFAALQGGLTHCVVAGKTVISYIPEHGTPDMMAEVADLMLRLSGTRVSVCYGLYGDVIHISVRGYDARSNVGRRLKRAVRGLGTGGGHRSMAGGQVPTLGTAERRLALVRERLLRVFAAGNEPHPLLDLAD